MTTEPTPPDIEVPKIIELTICTVDLGQQVVISGDKRIKLDGREVQLLQYLGARPSQVVPRDEIFTEVWGYEPNTLSRAVDHTVKRLRAKIEADPSNPKHIFSPSPPLRVSRGGYSAPTSERRPHPFSGGMPTSMPSRKC
jgi:hypothetical protein